MPSNVTIRGVPDANVVAVGSVQVETMLPLRKRPAESAERPEMASKPRSRPPVPRITRLMALAIKSQEMIERGEVGNYADVARLGHVTPARVTQIMNLLLLAPSIQESILQFGTLPATQSVLSERNLRPVTLIADWGQQRLAWERLKR